MQKLIKLSDSHYVVVDDSEIKLGNWVLDRNNDIYCQETDKIFQIFTGSRKITHSTKPLRGVQFIILSEVEETVYGYNAEKMALEKIKKISKEQFLSLGTLVNIGDGYVLGFNAHKELVKEKLFTVEDMIDALKLYKVHIETNNESKHKWIQEPRDFIKSLLPKTEWECKVVDGKIELI